MRQERIGSNNVSTPSNTSTTTEEQAKEHSDASAINTREEDPLGLRSFI
jgi:hypothetical protein